MRIVTEPALRTALSALSAVPRVVASGNFAAPTLLLKVLDDALPDATLRGLGLERRTQVAVFATKMLRD